MTQPSAGSSASPTGYAFYMEPIFVEADGRWTASYPEADWSVSGVSEDDARARLRDEVERRQNAGEDALAYAPSVYERHLQSPVPGVYAMSNELYRELLMAGTSEEEVQRAFAEAEENRLAGQPYTIEDYRRGRRA